MAAHGRNWIIWRAGDRPDSGFRQCEIGIHYQGKTLRTTAITAAMPAMSVFIPRMWRASFMLSDNPRCGTDPGGVAYA